MNLKELLKKGKYNYPYKLYRFIKLCINSYKGREVHIKNINGLCSNDKMYIIRRLNGCGFFSNFFYVLGHLVYASEKGYKVSVDMENYPTLYSEKEMFLGTKNAWEYYFEQPNDISLDIAYAYQYVILSKSEYNYENAPCYMLGYENFINESLIEKLSVYVDKYIRINKEIREEVDSMKKIWEGKVLGIHIRGTDMRCASGHPVPVSVEKYKKEVDYLLENYKVSKIFCCTDEEAILEEFKTIYKDLIVHTSSLKSTGGQAVHKNKEIEREHHNYLLGKEVLMDALLLSRCDYLICGHSNVAYAAMVFNKNQYKKVELLESNDYTTT